MFRKKIGETSCKHLNEYPPIFFKFVKTHVMSHLVDDQIINLKVIINGFFEEIIDISKKELEEDGKEFFLPQCGSHLIINFPIFQ